MTDSTARFIRRFSLVILVLIALLLVARVAAPYVIRDRINKVLKNDLKGYEGSIRDFDLRLITGTYFVDDLKLRRRTAPADQYFIQAHRIQLNLSWRALFHARIMLNADLTDPDIELNDHDDPEKRQIGNENTNWTRTLKTIAPFDLQSIEVRNGVFHFRKADAKPAVDVVLDQINGEVRDIGNLRRLKKTDLPSNFFFMTRIQGHARLHVAGQGSFLEGPPAVNVQTDLRGLRLPTLNDFFRKYGYFDITRGILAVSGSARVQWPDMNLDFFPAIQNLKMIAPDQKYKGPRGFLTEYGLALTNLLARSSEDKILETELRLHGSFPHLKLDTWRAVKGLFEEHKNGSFGIPGKTKGV